MQVKPSSAKQRITALVLAAVAAGIMTAASLVQNPRSADFMSYYLSGSMLTHGLRHRLYDTTWQLSVVYPEDNPRPYARPPFEALLFVPLSCLPYRAAYVLWNLLLAGALGASVYLLRVHFAAVGLASRLLLAGALAIPFALNLGAGDDSLLLLLVLAAAFALARRGRAYVAGAVLALGLFRWQLLAPLLLLLFIQKRWRLMTGVLAGGGALAALSFALAGSGWLGAYRRLLAQMAVNGDLPRPESTPTVRGFIHLLLPATWAKLNGPAASVAAVPVGCLLAACFWRGWRAAWAETAAGAASELGFALAAALAVAVSFDARPYDLILLALPLVVAAGHAGRRGAPAWLLRTAMAALLLVAVMAQNIEWLPYAAAFPAIVLLATAIAAEIRLRPPLREERLEP